VIQRREVRVSDGFFRQLDEQLGAERGANGEPSATDFLVLDLPAVVEEFATRFDSLPEVVSGVSAGRVFVTTGLLVAALAVYGIALDDDAIELIGIEIDLGLD